MWIANDWKEYEVIDTSCGEKLERWGKYTLVRPDPQEVSITSYSFESFAIHIYYNNLSLSTYLSTYFRLFSIGDSLEFCK